MKRREAGVRMEEVLVLGASASHDDDDCSFRAETAPPVCTAVLDMADVVFLFE